MKPTLLEFNISKEKLKLLNRICSKLLIQIVQVESSDFSQTLGAILGVCERKNEVCFSPFKDEMLIMAGMDKDLLNQFLSELRGAKIVLPLKAVLTSSNINWRCSDLYSELSKEHIEIMKRVKK